MGRRKAPCASSATAPSTAPLTLRLQVGTSSVCHVFLSRIVRLGCARFSQTLQCLWYDVVAVGWAHSFCLTSCGAQVKLCLAWYCVASTCDALTEKLLRTLNDGIWSGHVLKYKMHSCKLLTALCTSLHHVLVLDDAEDGWHH